MGRTLVGQALRDLEPVHGMHPIKVLGHQPGLVALHRPNAVPLQGGRAHLAQCRHFFYGFLQVVFAKGVLPGAGGFEHGIGPEGFGYSQ
jgi:hypothetical protein